MTENEAKEMLEKHYQFLRETWKPSPDEKVLDALGIAISSIEEIQRYRAIGTVEECREARERRKGKKPKSINKVDEDTIYMKCADCGLTTVLYSGMEPDYCPKCGQKLDWSVGNCETSSKS